MNPWQSLRSEFRGAVRSIRYDLAVRKARRHMNADTMVLPVIGAAGGSARRRRAVLAVGALLVPVAGVSGYLATANSFGAMFPQGATPAGLPEARRPGATTPEPSPSPGGAFPMRQELSPLGGPAPRTSGPPRPAPTGTPPVPTPAPTCGCVTPSPSPSPTPRPSGTPSPDPTPSPPPSPSPTSSATP